MLDMVQKERLKTNVSRNLHDLIIAVGLTQAKLAEKTGVSEPTVSKYLNGIGLPPIDFLLDICTMQEFKEKGLDFTIDSLISDKFNPSEIMQKRRSNSEIVTQQGKHRDFLGNYLCYFYDQSKFVHNQDHKASRELRYGVVSIFDVCEDFTETVTVRAKAAFFKEAGASDAFELKRFLDSVFELNGDISIRNSKIQKAFEREEVSPYDGTVSFSDHHIFVNVESNIYSDNALIILYSPQKRADSEFIGGIGSVASVTRGRTHMPTAQKIIMSKYELKCSREVISEHLSMYAAPIEQENEADVICKFCYKLYLDSDYALNIDEQDKAAMVRRRLDKLVRDYVDKNVCCVGVVTEDEDKEVFKLIEQYKD